MALLFESELNRQGNDRLSKERKAKLVSWVEKSSKARLSDNSSDSIDRIKNQYDKAEELLTWYTFAPLLRMSQEQRDSTVKTLLKDIYPEVASEGGFEIGFENIFGRR